MKTNQNEIEVIEQYLEGSLDTETRRMVDEKISTDQDYAGDIEQYKLLMDGIRYSGRKEFHAKLKKWDLELSDDIGVVKEKTLQMQFKWYYAAAAITFFMVASFLIYYNLNSGYDRIVADHYKPYNNFADTKRGEKTDKNFIEEIFDHYDRGEYNQALQMIQNLDENQKTIRVNFILANVYQAMKNYNEAIPIYAQIIESGSIYTNGSKWYMALCYLSTDNVEKARPLLTELKVSKSSYSPKAKSLLKDLD